MNTKRIKQTLWSILSAALVMATGQPAVADDTEIFFGRNALTGPSNYPNVLLVIDSSGSMRNSVNGDAQNRDRLEVVQDVANDFIANMENVNMGIMKYDIRVGRNDAYSDGGMVVHAVESVASARSSLTAEVNRIQHIGNTPLQETYYEAARYFMGEPVHFGVSSKEGYYGSDGRAYARSRPSVSDSYTTIDGVKTYTSPITSACQRNYVVYLTDGAPTSDVNGTALITNMLNDSNYAEHDARACANPDGLTRGGECVDELAEFLYDNDFNSTLPGKQNVISHFIGFAIDLPFLQRAADAGGGEYHQASNAETLRTALTAILNNVADDVNGFTAPAVTVNAFDRTTHLNRLYFTVFQPKGTNHWDGNVKKYNYIANNSDDGLLIVGQDNLPAVNPDTGFFYDGRDLQGQEDPNVPTAWSFWSAEADGADVRIGGAASKFGLNRNVLTNSGNNATLLTLGPSLASLRDNLTGVTIPFSPGAPIPDPSTSSRDVAEKWLSWAAGIDVNDEDGDGASDDARQRMGDPLHSKPAVVVYGGTADAPELVLFVGTNDGFLHGIDGESGEELFAFMPDALWDNIPKLAENTDLGRDDRVYGVDGPITIWKNDGGDGEIDAQAGDFVYLYFGLRRGGRHYYALDVTSPEQPKLLWKFSNADYSDLGQTWSPPTQAKVNFGTEVLPNEKDVLVFGGGYDPDQDSRSGYADDDVGNAILMVDANSGDLLWSASDNNSSALTLSDMKSAIPAGVRVIDLNLDGLADRMYTTDIVGRIWRFDIHNDTNFKITGGVVAELGASEQSGSSNNRRFYYAPDVALGSEHGQSFLTITTASGFRAHPLETTINDYLVGVRDYQPFSLLGASENPAAEYDFGTTIGNLRTQSLGSTVSIPSGAHGWKIALPSGEKSLARSRIFQNTAYFTTYTPGAPPASNPCAAAVGRGALYTLNLGSGQIVRAELNKPGIPPEPTFIFGPPVDQQIELDTCFGPTCADYEEPVECEAGVDCEEFEATDPDGRRIECLAGPESCAASGNEFPTRTFWRQLDPPD